MAKWLPRWSIIPATICIMTFHWIRWMTSQNFHMNFHMKWRFLWCNQIPQGQSRRICWSHTWITLTCKWGEVTKLKTWENLWLRLICKSSDSDWLFMVSWILSERNGRMMSIWKFLDCVYFSHMKFRSYVRPGMVTLSWTSMNLVPSPFGGSCGEVKGDDDDLGNGCTCPVSGFLLEVCLGILGATWTASNSRCIQDVWFARFRWADFRERFEHWHISQLVHFYVETVYLTSVLWCIKETQCQVDLRCERYHGELSPGLGCLTIWRFQKLVVEIESNIWIQIGVW